MQVLVFSELFYPHGGGAELATWLYVKMLSEQEDVRLVVVTRRFPGESPVERVNKNLTIYRIPFTFFGSRYDTLINIGRIASEWIVKKLRESDVVYIPGSWYSVIPIAKAFRKSVIVHLHNYFIACPTSLMCDFFSGEIKPSSLKGFIAHERVEKKRKTSEVVLSAFLNETLGNLYRKLGIMADKLICVSRRQYEIITKVAPELANKLSVIYNPLPNVPLITKNMKNPAFLYLGGDSYIKGFHVLLEASQKLLKRYPEASFMLAGNYRSSSARIVSRLGRNYSLLGYVSHEEVLKLYSHSIALLFPSICEEPLPYAVIESMLTGTIPIASRIGGVPEIVGGTYAENFTFTPGSVSELIDRMEVVLSMSLEQLNDVGYRLRDSILRRFNNERIKQELLRIFTP